MIISNSEFNVNAILKIKKAEETAREKAIIEVLNGKNPYTNEEIKDHADVEEYLLMKEIEKNGGDPLSDFSKYQKEKDKKENETNSKVNKLNEDVEKINKFLKK